MAAELNRPPIPAFLVTGKPESEFLQFVLVLDGFAPYPYLVTANLDLNIKCNDQVDDLRELDEALFHVLLLNGKSEEGIFDDGLLLEVDFLHRGVIASTIRMVQ